MPTNKSHSSNAAHNSLNSRVSRMHASAVANRGPSMASLENDTHNNADAAQKEVTAWIIDLLVGLGLNETKPLRHYMADVIELSESHDPVLIHTLLFLQRLEDNEPDLIIGRSDAALCLFLTALLLAWKCVYDKPFFNDAWALISADAGVPFSRAKIYSMEVELLKYLNFELYVSDEEYRGLYTACLSRKSARAARSARKAERARRLRELGILPLEEANLNASSSSHKSNSSRTSKSGGKHSNPRAVHHAKHRSRKTTSSSRKADSVKSGSTESMSTVRSTTSVSTTSTLVPPAIDGGSVYPSSPRKNMYNTSAASLVSSSSTATLLAGVDCGVDSESNSVSASMSQRRKARKAAAAAAAAATTSSSTTVSSATKNSSVSTRTKRASRDAKTGKKKQSGRRDSVSSASSRSSGVELAQSLVRDFTVDAVSAAYGNNNDSNSSVYAVGASGLNTSSYTCGDGYESATSLNTTVDIDSDYESCSAAINSLPVGMPKISYNNNNNASNKGSSRSRITIIDADEANPSSNSNETSNDNSRSTTTTHKSKRRGDKGSKASRSRRNNKLITPELNIPTTTATTTSSTSGYARPNANNGWNGVALNSARSSTSTASARSDRTVSVASYGPSSESLHALSTVGSRETITEEDECTASSKHNSRRGKHASSNSISGKKRISLVVVDAPNNTNSTATANTIATVSAVRSALNSHLAVEGGSGVGGKRRAGRSAADRVVDLDGSSDLCDAVAAVMAASM